MTFPLVDETRETYQAPCRINYTLPNLGHNQELIEHLGDLPYRQDRCSNATAGLAEGAIALFTKHIYHLPVLLSSLCKLLFRKHFI
jgi:hypothetical protein